MSSYESFSGHVHSINSCPRCQFDISNDRLEAEILVCNHCGYTNDQRMQSEQNSIAKKFAQGTVIAAVLLIVSFVHVVQWDRHFFSIMTLSAKSMTGMADSQDLREIVSICKERMKHSCTEDALYKLAKLESNNPDLLFDLGEIRRKTGQIDGAVAAYKAHFERDGQSVGAAYEWARIEESRGQIEKAKELYARALSLKTDVLQVTVIQTYVNMLLKANQFSEAKTIIEDVRKLKGPSAQYFMANEMAQVQKGLGLKVTENI
jgi:tetratricopeptide (TPR) repeat protein